MLPDFNLALKHNLLIMVKKQQLIEALIALALLVTIFSSCSFSEKTARRMYINASDETYDMIVVPGVPLENGTWSRTMKARIYWSKFLFDKGIAKNIMYSGSANYTAYYEGDIMAMYAEAVGIPREHIFSETKAEHSTENLYYGYYKSKKLGFKRIALATDPYQAKQLTGFAKLKLSERVDVIPMVFDTLRAMEPAMTDPVIDQQKAFKKDFVSIKKRDSWWKRFKGTMSWNIDKKAYK
jgi:hypothetical protein